MNPRPQIIQRCKKSVAFFLRNFAKIKHPSAGILPLNPFKYQIKALKSFRDHRFTIFKKCRQSGLSQISGAFALWFAMFYSNKTVLIVSKTDDDAMTYFREKVMFIFNHLPKWMKDLWLPPGSKKNDHEVVFANGSSIKSLTSAPDCLRSNASSLNIIDEAAFIPQMGLMWAAGYPTLQHGGSVIIISTCNGVGNWYWSTWTDAEADMNAFNPIDIQWWDMDWVIEYTDPLSQQHRRIAPTDGLRKCTTPEDIAKYGQYWSPWLEEQYLGLQERGESWKFDQEILAEFVGSGNTVLEQMALAQILSTVDDNYQTIEGDQVYDHPITSNRIELNFSPNSSDFKKEEGLWVWKPPVVGTAPVKENDRIISQGIQPHAYVAGVDIATGKAQDYHALEIFDVDFQEQVAEIMVRCKPKMFMYMIDYVCRWYNNALMVIERNNGGDLFIDSMRDELMYPNIWRRKRINDKPSSSNKVKMSIAEYGHMTNNSTKPHLNRLMITHFKEDDSGFKIYSRRLYKQLQIYVRKKDRAGRDTNKTEAEDGPGNHDDLVIAAALALAGLQDVGYSDGTGLIPYHVQPNLADIAKETTLGPQNVVTPEQLTNTINRLYTGSDPKCLPPIVAQTQLPTDVTAMAEIAKFTAQLGGMPIAQTLPSVRPKKHNL